MYPYNVADEKFFIVIFGGLGQLLTLFYCFCQRLFYKHMRTGLEAFHHVFIVGVGVGIDGNCIRLSSFQGFIKIIKQGDVATQFFIQFFAAGGSTTYQAYNLKFRHFVVSFCMGGTHVAASGNQHFDRFTHSLLVVRFLVCEKIDT